MAPSQGHRGNAPAEFVLVSALLVATVLGVLHLSTVVHVRHTLVSSAFEGASVAARFGADPSDGVAYTRQLLLAGLSPRYAEHVVATPVSLAGVPGVRITVRAPYPTLGIWSAEGELTVWADAALERPR